MLPLVLPEIVVGVATLALFSTLGLSLGYGNLIIAHTVFCIPFAYLPIAARLQGVPAAFEEAAMDLYASRWEAFRLVLLPLMALVLKILYPLSRRYFVEHLLFIVHFHAFFFLILTLEILFSRIGPALGLPRTLTNLTLVAASFYIPVYLYMAMRRVYGQGHFLTFLKYVALVVAYSLGMSLTMFGAVLLALVAV